MNTNTAHKRKHKQRELEKDLDIDDFTRGQIYLANNIKRLYYKCPDCGNKVALYLRKETFSNIKGTIKKEEPRLPSTLRCGKCFTIFNYRIKRPSKELIDNYNAII